MCHIDYRIYFKSLMIAQMHQITENDMVSCKLYGFVSKVKLVAIKVYLSHATINVDGIESRDLIPIHWIYIYLYIGLLNRS